MPKFKLDENLPVEAAELMQTDGLDAITVADQNLEGEIDSRIIAVCLDEERALVTLDLDFSDIRAYPPEDYQGISVLRVARQSRRHVLSALTSAIAMLEQEELTGRLWIVTESRIRIYGDD